MLGMIGPVALHPLEIFLTDGPTEGYLASLAVEGIGHVAEYHPDQRDPCVAVLTRFLARFADQEGTFNAWLVWGLMDLKAVESIDSIRAAFNADKVDWSIAGDLEDVEIDLGLREKRTKPRPRYQLISGPPRMAPSPAPKRLKVGRNDPCPCGSGKKYKKCCAA